MDQNDNNLTSRRFIFSDAFYDQMENINNQNEKVEETVTTPTPQSIMNDVNNQNNIIKDENNTNNLEETPNDTNIKIPNIDLNNVNPTITPADNISEDKPGSNAFFNNQVIKTTTVYDNIGNTISKTVDDGNTETVLVEPPKVEEIAEDDGLPNLGIPKPKDMPVLQEREQPDLTKVGPNVSENDVNLNVVSGIDTSLEQQLMSNKQEYTPQFNFFDIPPIGKPEGVTKYRAVRRQINPVNTKEDNDIDTLDDAIIKPIEEFKEQKKEEKWKPDITPTPIEITEEINYDEPLKEEHVTKSDLIEKLVAKEKETGKISILARYGDDFCSHDYITNPAIGRDKEIKELGLILLTPEKSAILVGKPGIGKTSIVEGLAYQIQRDNVPDALKGYTIISVKTTSLLGNLTNGETRLQTLIDELKGLDKIILFIDEVHMLMGATNESSLDFANMFKESLGRGSIKMIGATTSDEYERYVLRDKAFVRRFQRVDVNEPSREETIEILMGTLPKIEKTTGAKLKYTQFIKTEIMSFIVDITTEYKRVYGIGSRYPDICITLLNQAFSEAVFNNRTEVNIFDIRNAIQNSKNIYPDVIRKELVNFDQKFKNTIEEENNQ